MSDKTEIKSCPSNEKFTCEELLEAYAIDKKAADRAILEQAEKISELEAKVKVLEGMLCLDKAWPIIDVLNELIRSSEILLNDLSYDGHGHEKIAVAKNEAMNFINRFKEELER